ncbi:MAG: (d)CMP kinase [Anaerolineales bacterium]|nr:(d)CMP kinase [Anaerolineales bacterium]
MKYPNIIAIDGPAASGKTTIANQLAKKWGYLLFDTGVMYRAVTWMALHKNISTKDESMVTDLADRIKIDVAPPSLDDGREYDVIADGIDVTWKIRKKKVDSRVSRVSAYSGVRKALTKQQRRIGLNGKVIMVGRDIGTVVLPEADLKIYLDACVEERANRRYKQRVDRGEKADLSRILKKLERRDKIDSTREIAPLRAADDAVLINTDDMSISEVVSKIEKIALNVIKD